MMRLSSLFAGTLLLGTALVQAQIIPADLPGAVTLPAPLPMLQFGQLKTYLNLSDAQLQALIDILNSRNTAQQDIYKQISDKQSKLNALLQAGTSDAMLVGQLTLDINSLRKQLPIPTTTYRAAALKVLTADQAAKLPALAAALQLQQPAWQAITLDLIDAPASPTPIKAVAVPAGDSGNQTEIP